MPMNGPSNNPLDKAQTNSVNRPEGQNSLNRAGTNRLDTDRTGIPKSEVPKHLDDILAGELAPSDSELVQQLISNPAMIGDNISPKQLEDLLAHLGNQMSPELFQIVASLSQNTEDLPEDIMDLTLARMPEMLQRIYGQVHENLETQIVGTKNIITELSSSSDSTKKLEAEKFLARLEGMKGEVNQARGIVDGMFGKMEEIDQVAA